LLIVDQNQVEKLIQPGVGQLPTLDLARTHPDLRETQGGRFRFPAVQLQGTA
jgi:hypothetical protein